MNIRKISPYGREMEISDYGDVWRGEFTSLKGRHCPRKQLAQNNQKGYLSVGFTKASGEYCRMSVHRLVAEAFIDDFHPDLWVDHINGIRDDNRASNLRMVTPQQNHRGRYRKIQGASSRYRGVTWERSRRKWKASIYINKRSINLGSFEDEQQAALAFDRAAILGGFLRESLNFPRAS